MTFHLLIESCTAEEEKDIREYMAESGLNITDWQECDVPSPEGNTTICINRIIFKGRIIDFLKFKRENQFELFGIYNSIIVIW